MTTPSHTRSHAPLPGWTLVTGLALSIIGLASGAQDTPQQLPSSPSFATSDSNDAMIAVTGVDVTGSSVLYVIDTVTRNLSVYQATGGTKSTANIRWVGARNIDLDLRVDGWNDKSEMSFKALRDAFEKNPQLTGGE